MFKKERDDAQMVAAEQKEKVKGGRVENTQMEIATSTDRRVYMIAQGAYDEEMLSYIILIVV